MSKSIRTILLAATAIGALLAMGSAGAFAQTGNPCAPKAGNPCAAKPMADMPMMDKKAANPCAPKAANPCAMKPANPCAPKK